MFSQAFQNHLLSHNVFEGTLKFESIVPISGGDINSAFRIDTAKQTFFLKLNNLSFDKMFAKEANGLNAIAATGTIKTPKIFAHGQFENTQYLLLEWIEIGLKKSFAQLGSQLAQLHKTTRSHFGFFENNFIGSLTQLNQAEPDFITFFITQRLEPLVKKARDAQLLESHQVAQFIALYNKLPELIPHSKPSLLHGDMWSGNVIFNQSGEPVLIDPATYFGHYEMELAFTQMFGGFPSEFYNAYFNSTEPIPGFQKRVPVYNLYPTLVHLLLFGKSYLPGIRSTLNTFS
ncbi:MAG: fructosamine kinase family protein [Bacteroidetes bacterium]|nr:fructosamine kinase family protein [Bacteroidota bacterium]